MLQPTTSNLRAEMARCRLKANAIAKSIGIHKNYLYMMLRDERPMKGNMAYKIGAAINRLQREEIFMVPPDLGEGSV